MPKRELSANSLFDHGGTNTSGFIGIIGETLGHIKVRQRTREATQGLEHFHDL